MLGGNDLHILDVAHLLLKAISECVILADSLGYQGLNAKSAKVTFIY